MLSFFAVPLVRSQKGLTKPKNRTNSTKELSEQFEGISGSLPSKTRVLRQIAPGSSPERLAKSLSHSFFLWCLFCHQSCPPKVFALLSKQLLSQLNWALNQVHMKVDQWQPDPIPRELSSQERTNIPWRPHTKKGLGKLLIVSRTLSWISL